jgi:hypothetical protein
MDRIIGELSTMRVKRGVQRTPYLLWYTTTLEEKDVNVSQAEEDKVPSLRSCIGAEVAACDTMPCGIVLQVELFLDESGNLSLITVLPQGFVCDVDSSHLHSFRHIDTLDHCFSLRHGDSGINHGDSGINHGDSGINPFDEITIGCNTAEQNVGLVVRDTT